MLGRAGQHRVGMETAFEERGNHHCCLGGEVIPSRLQTGLAAISKALGKLLFSVLLCSFPAFLWQRDSCCIHGAQHRGTWGLAGAAVGDKNIDLFFVFYTKISP